MGFLITLAHPPEVTTNFLIRFPGLFFTVSNLQLTLFDLLTHLLQSINNFRNLKILQTDLTQQFNLLLTNFTLFRFKSLSIFCRYFFSQRFLKLF